MNNEYVSVMHVYALGKSWPVKLHQDEDDCYYFVSVDGLMYAGDTIEELQQKIDKELER